MTSDNAEPTISKKLSKGQKRKKRLLRPFLRVRTLLIVVSLASFAYSGWYFWQRWQAQKPTDQPLAPVAASEEREEGDRPAENKPDVEKDNYEVPADHPRRIIVEALGVNGFVQQVGTTPENAVDVPGNIHVAGWYDASVLPGQPGLSIIDGHVSGVYSNGIFYDLKNLSTGMKFTIEFGDRTTKTFEVVRMQQVPEKDSAKLLFDRDEAILSQLNLITCGGKFDSATEQYADRVIVVSKLVE